MNARVAFCMVMLAAGVLAGCARQNAQPPQEPDNEEAALLRPGPVAPDEPVDRSEQWAIIGEVLREGALQDGVYTVIRPRRELVVGHVDLGEVPTGAGVESRFHFFWCPCGKMSVVGQFAAADYEVNAIIDELRKGEIEVVGLTPMFIGSRPRMYVLRFQGRNSSKALATTIRNALKLTEG